MSVWAVQNDILCIFILLRSFDSGSSREGMRSGLELAEQLSRDIDKSGRREVVEDENDLGSFWRQTNARQFYC